MIITDPLLKDREAAPLLALHHHVRQGGAAVRAGLAGARMACVLGGGDGFDRGHGAERFAHRHVLVARAAHPAGARRTSG